MFLTTKKCLDIRLNELLNITLRVLKSSIDSISINIHDPMRRMQFIKSGINGQSIFRKKTSVLSHNLNSIGLQVMPNFPELRIAILSEKDQSTLRDLVEQLEHHIILLISLGTDHHGIASKSSPRIRTERTAETSSRRHRKFDLLNPIQVINLTILFEVSNLELRISKQVLRILLNLDIPCWRTNEIAEIFFMPSFYLQQG